ncbi:THO complex subunit 2 isoform X4 [Gigaspora margarita]|uniref:THO complex subunit 2 n=1 Tax=Gigaspora margarita TaxID=4874 RepID=A0A8H4AWT5_GIGMA|nr:THO complex subunit 2 isoform X4 [Gigaspora margarita]
MEDDLIEAFTEVVINNKPTSTLGPVFEKFQNGEQESEALAQCVLDVIWYIDSTIIDGVNDKATENDCRRNLISIVKYLHANNIVDTKSMKTKLDISLLENAGVVEEKTFGRRCVRINTAMLYKQQKYNLAREESEGYAKLICELAMCCDSIYKEDDVSLNARTQSILEAIQTLIGFFNLDPNRVLDLILDIFIVNVKIHYEFFIQLLKNSPWLPDPMDVMENHDEWSDDKGNPICAQLLGIKYTRYEGSDTIPNAFSYLYVTSAILIHNQIVKIADLYPYILKESEDNPHEHEIGLVCALLEIGDFYHARYILYHLPEIEESIANCLRQMINVAIYELYAPIAPRLVKRLQPPTFFGSWYKRWREGIPVIHSFSDLIEGQGRQLLLFIGPWLARDLILFTKIMRITYRHLEESKKNSSDYEIIKNKWLDIIRSTIMPSIAMPDTTCGVIDELWNIIKLFPYKTRFTIYAEWKSAYEVYKPLKDQCKKVSHETKKILKRITEENCREKGRELAKISHANPTIVFEIILKQIQAYGNMINSIVEACKYFTVFEYDILTYQMLEVFSCDRERLKDDGINISDWLKHLSEFCGNMCRKYEKMNLSSILLFIVCRLKDRNSVDLCVLSQLITAMSGIKYEMIPSKFDVALMGTGEHLRNIKLFNRNQKNVRRNSSRLCQTLVEEGFAVKIAVLIAQLTQSIPYEALGESSKHLKSVVHRMDLCRNTYIQYVDFLAITIGMDEYFNIIPDIEKLVKTFHLQMEYAFMLLRPVLNYKLKQYADESSSMDVDETVIWQPPLSNIIEQVRSTLPSHVWNGISPQFFITFWQMSLYDLEFPQEEYRKAKNDLLNSANGDKVRDKSKIIDVARQIDKDMRKHEQHVKNVKNRLRIEKDQWFSGQFTNRQDIITQFWQYCLFPRLNTSADNAVFCAKFIETMHEIGTVNFSTLTLYDRIFADQVQPLIFTCSESEARNYGTFLQTILASLSKLHKNPQEYENRGKGSGIPGFQMKWSAHNRQPASISENDLLRYEDFRLVYYKWHSRLLRAFEQNLQSMEYFSVRNSIIALNTIVTYFPAIDTFGKKLQDDIDKIVKSEERGDIRTLALSYSAKLKGKQQSWVSVRSFQKAKNSLAVDSAQHDERSEKGSSKHDENPEKGPQKRDERSEKGSASPAQRTTQSPVITRSGPLSNVRGAHPSSPSYLTTRASPRMQIHPLPDKPMKPERGPIREKEHEKEKEHERDRTKDRKDMQIERDKEIKKGEHHDRDKEISKKLDHYDRDKERELERDRKQEISRNSDDKKDPLMRNKERLMNDDPNKRTDHRPRDRDDKIKEKERDKRDDRREERRDKVKEKEREKSRERERTDEDRDRRESDRGKRKHTEEPTIRRSRDNVVAQRFISKKRDRTERDRDGEPEQIPSNKRRNIEGISQVLRPPVKLTRAMEHNDFVAPMPGKSIGGKRNDKRDTRRRY